MHFTMILSLDSEESRENLDEIAMPVDRSIKHASLIGSITADGTRLKAVIIVPRKTLEIEVQLWGDGEKHASLVYQEHGFLSTTIFECSIMTGLIPYIAEERGRTGYSGPALLILDRCACHGTERVRQAPVECHIRPVLIPTHPSDQVQPLDLGIFSTFKRLYMKRLALAVTIHQSGQIIRMCEAWRQPALPRNIARLFGVPGLCRSQVLGRSILPSTILKRTKFGIGEMRLASNRSLHRMRDGRRESLKTRFKQLFRDPFLALAVSACIHGRKLLPVSFQLGDLKIILLKQENHP
jgi:hypothetical protein